MNKSTHIIQFDDVHKTLQAIRYARLLPRTSLSDYLTMQDIISFNMPHPLQDYLIMTWLSNIITSRYNAYRRYYGLMELSSGVSKHELTRLIRDDYTLSNPKFESRSIIFLR